MASKITYTYWDSCVFLSYVAKIPDRIEMLDAVLEEVREDRERKLIASAFAIAEVAFASGHGSPTRRPTDEEARIDELWEAPFIELVEVNRFILYQARTLMRDAVDQSLPLKPNDAVHLATAAWVNEHVGPVNEFQTYDKKLMNCNALISIPIREPTTLQPRLLNGE